MRFSALATKGNYTKNFKKSARRLLLIFKSGPAVDQWEINNQLAERMGPGSCRHSVESWGSLSFHGTMLEAVDCTPSIPVPSRKSSRPTQKLIRHQRSLLRMRSVTLGLMCMPKRLLARKLQSEAFSARQGKGLQMHAWFPVQLDRKKDRVGRVAVC